MSRREDSEKLDMSRREDSEELGMSHREDSEELNMSRHEDSASRCAEEKCCPLADEVLPNGDGDDFSIRGQSRSNEDFFEDPASCPNEDFCQNRSRLHEEPSCEDPASHNAEEDTCQNWSRCAEDCNGDKCSLGEKSCEDSERNNPEDSRWCWAVVVGCFINQMLFEGVVRSYGFIYLSLKERFHGSAIVTSWIQACFSGVALALGPVSTVLAEKFTVRTVVMCGGALIGLGLLLSSLTPNLYFLYFSYSFLGGVGGSMIYSPMFLIVSQYFDRKRGLALGLSSLGSALGTYAVPTLTAFLMDEFGYRGCMLILSALTLNHCVSGSLYRPITQPDMSHDAPTPPYSAGIDDVTTTRLKISDVSKSVDDVARGQRPLSALPPHVKTFAFYSDGAINKKPLERHRSTDSGNAPTRRGLSSLSVRHRAGSRGSGLARSINKVFDSALSLSIDLEPPVSQHLLVDSNYAEAHKPLAVVVNGDGVSLMTSVSKLPPASYRVPGCEQVRVTALVNGDAVSLSDPHRAQGREVSRLAVFRLPAYVIFCFEIFTLSSTVMPTFAFLPPLAKESGYTEREISLMLALIGLAGLAGSFGIGLIFDTALVRRHKPLFYALIAVFQGGATVLIALLSASYVAMVIASSCVGLVITSLIGQRANVTSFHVSPDDLPFAFGVVTMFQGLGNLFGPAIQGMLKDRFHTYKPCFYFGGGFLIFSSLIVIAEYLIQRQLRPRAPS